MAVILPVKCSKIEKVEDLEHIASLGFRGEALSSIAAVAQVELITKTPSALSGVRYVINGGVQESLEDMGASEGTTFLVRNLFYNTPARSKFLKSDTTEGNYVSTLMEQLALSHPEISFKYIQRLSPAGIRSLRKDRETALPEDNDTGTEYAVITGMDRPTGTRTTRPNFRIT